MFFLYLSLYAVCIYNDITTCVCLWVSMFFLTSPIVVSFLDLIIWELYTQAQATAIWMQEEKMCGWSSLFTQKKTICVSLLCKCSWSLDRFRFDSFYISFLLSICQTLSKCVFTCLLISLSPAFSLSFVSSLIPNDQLWRYFVVNMYSTVLFSIACYRKKSSFFSQQHLVKMLNAASTTNKQEWQKNMRY